MSLSEQFAQYAYGKTVAAVMTDPERDMSEIATAAARANMDVIFGESHDVMSNTMSEISEIIRGMPHASLGGVVLEVPIEMQDVFSPEVLGTISNSEAVIMLLEAQAVSLENEAQIMLSQGVVDDNQFNLIAEIIAKEREIITHLPHSSEFLENAHNHSFHSIVEMARVAIDNGVPVYAADVDRQRLIASLLLNQNSMPEDQANKIFAEGLDDRSDVDYLVGLGLELQDGEKPLIVHRGYGHISGSYMVDGIQTDGIHQVLEEYGRQNITISILGFDGQRVVSENPRIENTPAQFKTTIGLFEDSPKLDRSDYIEEAEPLSTAEPQSVFLPKL